MCNNSLIYLASPNPNSVLSGGTLPLNTIVRRRGCSVQKSGDSVILGASGYYHVSVTETFTAPAAGTVTLQGRIDNNAVTGATASTTITTANTEVRSLSYEFVVRVNCCNGPVTLSFVNTGVAINTSNIAVAVEYLD